ncbi:unnamed protein product [Vicia faba]|uniref:Uncharacterized protein n=1 Tax=Vicia faba TaxID=3906 RepID=A0AAV1AI37_VICFA|nr:unnamed protein product [Vicia faba]
MQQGGARVLKNGLPCETAVTKWFGKCRYRFHNFICYTLWLIHTETTAIRVATPIPTEIAKALTRPQPFFKTMCGARNDIKDVILVSRVRIGVGPY